MKQSRTILVVFSEPANGTNNNEERNNMMEFYSRLGGTNMDASKAASKFLYCGYMKIDLLEMITRRGGRDWGKRSIQIR